MHFTEMYMVCDCNQLCDYFKKNAFPSGKSLLWFFKCKNVFNQHETNILILPPPPTPSFGFKSVIDKWSLSYTKSLERPQETFLRFTYLNFPSFLRDLDVEKYLQISTSFHFFPDFLVKNFNEKKPKIYLKEVVHKSSSHH